MVVACVEGKTMAEIARELERSEHTIRTVLRSEYGQKRKGELLDAVKEAAVSRLRMSAVKAADSWIKQLENANRGERAQHLPAKELLTHLKILDVAAPNVDKSTKLVIQIGGPGPEVEPE